MTKMSSRVSLLAVLLVFCFLSCASATAFRSRRAQPDEVNLDTLLNDMDKEINALTDTQAQLSDPAITRFDAPLETAAADHSHDNSSSLTVEEPTHNVTESEGPEDAAQEHEAPVDHSATGRQYYSSLGHSHATKPCDEEGCWESYPTGGTPHHLKTGGIEHAFAKVAGPVADAQGPIVNAEPSDHSDNVTSSSADHTSAEHTADSAPAEHTADSAPADHTSAPADHTSAPADHTSAPADHTSAPADHTSAPADHTSAPADHTSAPADHTSAPADAPATSEHEHQETSESHTASEAHETTVSHTEPSESTAEPTPIVAAPQFRQMFSMEDRSDSMDETGLQHSFDKLPKDNVDTALQRINSFLTSMDRDVYMQAKEHAPLGFEQLRFSESPRSQLDNSMSADSMEPSSELNAADGETFRATNADEVEEQSADEEGVSAASLALESSDAESAEEDRADFDE